MKRIGRFQCVALAALGGVGCASPAPSPTGAHAEAAPQAMPAEPLPTPSGPAGGASPAPPAAVAPVPDVNVPTPAVTSGRGFARAVTISLSSTETLRDVPVLLRLSPTFDYGKVQPDGSDLLAIDESGHGLPLEIDTWKPGGESLLWVRLPSLDPSGVTRVSLIYGGAKPLVSATDPLWDPASFLAVWHLSGDIRDAGPAKLDGAALVGKAAHVDAVIGQGVEFPPNSTSSIRLGKDLKALAGLKAATVSMLVFAGELPAVGEGHPPLLTFGTDHRPTSPQYEQSGGHDVFGVSLIGRPEGAQLEFHARANTGPDYFFAGFQSFTFERRRWVSLALTVDFATGTWLTYRDGKLVEGPKTVNFGASAFSDDLVSWQASLATDPEGCCGFFDGMLDEVRLERVVRSAEWLRIQNVVVANPSLVTMGHETILE